MKPMKRALYRFTLDCGRSGSLEGIFTATEREITRAYGKRCYFGEVLGKHSDVTCTLEQAHVKLLTEDEAFIAKAEEYGLIPTGFNPLDAIACRECGEPLKPPYDACRRKLCRERSAEASA